MGCRYHLQDGLPDGMSLPGAMMDQELSLMARRLL
jgi:hypothetical protein